MTEQEASVMVFVQPLLDTVTERVAGLEAKIETLEREINTLKQPQNNETEENSQNSVVNCDPRDYYIGGD